MIFDIVVQSCTGRASLLQVCTVKPRTPETVIILLFFTISGVFLLFVPVQLVRGAYAFPRNGNYSGIFYRFWGVRTICTEASPGFSRKR